MSSEMAGLVETSNNLAMVKIEGGEFAVKTLMRSSVDSAKDALAAKFEAENGSLICAELLGIAPKPQEPTPEARTEAYYQKRPCVDMVANAVRIYLTNLNNLIQR